MAKYLVETYYNCSFKVSHYLDSIDENELSNLEKREDGKFEIIDVKLDNRKTKSLDKNSKNVPEKNEKNKINLVSEKQTSQPVLDEKNNTFLNKLTEVANKRFKSRLKAKIY